MERSYPGEVTNVRDAFDSWMRSDASGQGMPSEAVRSPMRKVPRICTEMYLGPWAESSTARVLVASNNPAPPLASARSCARANERAAGKVTLAGSAAARKDRPAGSVLVTSIVTVEEGETERVPMPSRRVKRETVVGPERDTEEEDWVVSTAAVTVTVG